VYQTTLSKLQNDSSFTSPSTSTHVVVPIKFFLSLLYGIFHVVRPLLLNIFLSNCGSTLSCKLLVSEGVFYFKMSEESEENSPLCNETPVCPTMQELDNYIVVVRIQRPLWTRLVILFAWLWLMVISYLCFGSMFWHMRRHSIHHA
jgi:hypothetical protein